MVLLYVLVSESVQDARKFDQLDPFNHPRERRELILDCLRRHERTADVEICTIPTATNDDGGHGEADFDAMYSGIHSKGLLELLRTGWSKWQKLGEDGQVPSAKLGEGVVPINMTLPRVSTERPSQRVLGQMGYYCTDNCTPLFAALYPELCADAAVLRFATQQVTTNAAAAAANVYYCLLTHPGHHAAYDSFGGYCYVNHVVALAAQHPGTAILDVDYHAGNGTISMCHDSKVGVNNDEDNTYVVSIHCDPDYDYPFHSGQADEHNIPLPPGTTWDSYEVALREALRRIQAFRPKCLVVSLGLDTYQGDPCAIRRAGFNMAGADYVKMGEVLAEMTDPSIPTYFVQEGGYRMDAVGTAACDVVITYAAARRRA
jgi:acetoin utilization deacetylase AcuC-like enzyme